MSHPQSAETPKLFLSYSRRNSAFIDELIISIESYGFDVQFDRADLFPGEPWEPRLRSMISESDTTVCVLSNAWMESSECIKELQIALELGRRVIPVLIDPIDPSNMPPELARLQFIFFHGEGHSYARGVVDLIEALRTDIRWVREQTRLLDKANEWSRANSSAALLLRGTALESALEWVGSKPPEHTHILPLLAGYIQASEDNAKDQVRKKMRGRFWMSALTGLAIAGVLGIAVLYFQNQAAEARADALFLEREKLEAERQALLAQVELNAADIANFDEEEAASAPAPRRRIVTRSPARGLGTPRPSAPAQGDDENLGVSRGREPMTPVFRDEPAPLPAPQTEAQKLVARLNSDDKTTRIQAGQEVAEAVRGKNAQPVLAALIEQLQEPYLSRLSSSGRFNMLYMLNIYNNWRQSGGAGELAAALDAVEDDAASYGLAIGKQTRDCIVKLRAKVDGQSGVEDRCG